MFALEIKNPIKTDCSLSCRVAEPVLDKAWTRIHNPPNICICQTLYLDTYGIDRSIKKIKNIWREQNFNDFFLK